MGYERFVSCHFLEPVDTRLVPVVGSVEEFQLPRFWSLCLCRGGVDASCMRTLKQESVTGKDPVPARLALVNARSLANKTLILNDFFTSNRLDFLFVTETWMGDN